MLLSSNQGISGKGAVVGIGLNIYAINNFTGPAAGAHKSLRALQAEFRRTLTENLRAARNTYGAMAMAGAIVTRGLAGSYRAFAQFEYTMKGTQIVARATSREYDEMSREALRLGETTMFRSSAIAEQMRQMAKSGMDVNAIMNNIRAVVAGAGASMESLDHITRVMIATMSQFQIPSENAMHTIDRLTAAALNSRATIESLGEGLKMSAADFYALNIPLEQALATLMQMANFGIDATMAGTAIGNMLRYLTKGVGPMHTSRQAQALELLGFTPENFRTAEGGLKDLTEIFTMLNQRMDEVPDLEKHAGFEALFGIRGKRGAMPLTIDPGQFERNVRKVAESMGLAANNLGRMMDTHEGRIQMLISAWDTFKIKFGEALSPLLGALTQILRGATRFLSWLASAGEGRLKGVVSYLISGGAALLIWKIGVWAVKAAFAGLAMLFVSNRVSHENMTRAMAMGWDFVKARLMGYKGELATLMTMQNYMAATAKSQSARMAASSIAYNRLGRAHVKAGHMIIDPATGKSFKGGAVLPASMLASMGIKHQRQTRETFVPRSRGKMGPLGAGAATRGAGLFARGILGRLAGFMMGPWGIALITISTLLPLLNRALSRNSKSIDDNTGALKTNIKVERTKAYDPQFFNIKDLVEANVQKRLLEHYIRTGEGDYRTRELSRSANINVNIDGKKVYEDRLSSTQAKEILKLGM
jgi:TP901 family phage tail tape measure protein